MTRLIDNPTIKNWQPSAAPSYTQIQESLITNEGGFDETFLDSVTHEFWKAVIRPTYYPQSHPFRNPYEAYRSGPPEIQVDGLIDCHSEFEHFDKAMRFIINQKLNSLEIEINDLQTKIADLEENLIINIFQVIHLRSILNEKLSEANNMRIEWIKFMEHYTPMDSHHDQSFQDYSTADLNQYPHLIDAVFNYNANQNAYQQSLKDYICSEMKTALVKHQGHFSFTFSRPSDKQDLRSDPDYVDFSKRKLPSDLNQIIQLMPHPVIAYVESSNPNAKTIIYVPDTNHLKIGPFFGQMDVLLSLKDLQPVYGTEGLQHDERTATGIWPSNKNLKELKTDLKDLSEQISQSEEALQNTQMALQEKGLPSQAKDVLTTLLSSLEESIKVHDLLYEMLKKEYDLTRILNELKQSSDQNDDFDVTHAHFTEYLNYAEEKEMQHKGWLYASATLYRNVIPLEGVENSIEPAPSKSKSLDRLYTMNVRSTDALDNMMEHMNADNNQLGVFTYGSGHLETLMQSAYERDDVNLIVIDPGSKTDPVDQVIPRFE